METIYYKILYYKESSLKIFNHRYEIQVKFPYSMDISLQSLKNSYTISKNYSGIHKKYIN